MSIYINNRYNKGRSSLNYSTNICGSDKRQNLIWNSTINTYRSSVSSRVANYAGLRRNGLGGKPTWSYPVAGSRFGLANPHDYNPEERLNQYGRLLGTGGQLLRNF